MSNKTRINVSIDKDVLLYLKNNDVVISSLVNDMLRKYSLITEISDLELSNLEQDLNDLNKNISDLEKKRVDLVVKIGIIKDNLARKQKEQDLAQDIADKRAIQMTRSLKANNPLRFL